MKSKIYVARHKRYQAVEAYKDNLTMKQIEIIKETENDFWLEIDYIKGESVVLFIDDEG